MKIKIDVELKNTQKYANCVFLFYHWWVPVAEGHLEVPRGCP
jgi:hypothetical protein